MAGSVILSFDCEGKWGIADLLYLPYAKKLTDASIMWAYESIMNVLANHDLRATFAFVGLFLCSKPRQQEILAQLDTVQWPYLKAVASALEAGEEGWSAPRTIDVIHAKHEVAFHGFTHTPWSALTSEQARWELDMMPKEQRATIIFPRNEVAHLDVLADAGCEGYRMDRKFASRLRSLISEFAVYSSSEQPGNHWDRPIAIPAGYFINWTSGLRKIVPHSVTRLRVRNILTHAAETGGVAHFWTHPENIAAAPGTLENLRIIAEEIDRLRQSGSLDVLDQQAWCRRQRDMLQS